MMVARTMQVRYMVLISKISESGGLSKLSRAWLPITQKLEPHSRNSSSDSIVLLSPLPPPWAPLDNTAHKRKVPLHYNMRVSCNARPPCVACIIIIFRICTFRFLIFFFFFLSHTLMTYKHTCALFIFRMRCGERRS